MKVRVLFFGVLAEKAGTGNISLEGITDMVSLEKHILDKYPAFREFSYRIALNRLIVTGNKKLAEGDEIAFMPPFAGG